MSSETTSILMDSDLQTTVSGEITGNQAINGHISQIPGLSPTIGILAEERARGRRAGVLDSDSDYVKLAKQGGHKGLLWHEETINSKPNSYKAPEWFCTESEDIDETSERKKNSGAFQLLEPPFGSDNMSAWERNDSTNSKEKDNVDSSQMETPQSPGRLYEASKFKRIVFNKKPPPVDMSKLLSFGYAGDD